MSRIANVNYDRQELYLLWIEVKGYIDWKIREGIMVAQLTRSGKDVALRLIELGICKRPNKETLVNNTSKP